MDLLFVLENTKVSSPSLSSLRPPGLLPWLFWLETVAVWEAAWRRHQQNRRAKARRKVLQISECNRHPGAILGKNKERYHSVNDLSAPSLFLFLNTCYCFGEFYKTAKERSKWNLCGSLHQFRAITHASFSHVIAFDFTAVNRVLSLHITYHYTPSWVWCFGGD